jgi:capsular polysaccharide transport system permease protein
VRTGQSVKTKRRRSALISFLVMVGLPALLATLYFGFLASDQYHAEARFAVRGTENAPGDILGMITGTPGGGASSGDSYMLQQYIVSREMVEAVSASVDVEAVFNRPEADVLARLGEDKPIEAVVDYWTRMVSAEFDPYSGIITLEVRAFRADDAQVLASSIVRQSEIMVNRLADKARADAIAFAQRELEFAEWRLQDARRAVIEFQNSESTLDPTSNAQMSQQIVVDLEGRLSEARAQLASVSELAGPDSPSARVLQSQIAAMETQIAIEKRKVSGLEPSGQAVAGGAGLSGKIADFQELKTAEEFAKQVYMTTLSGLESARAEAKRTHSYLATFVSPMVAQQALYPLRTVNTILIIVVAIGIWAIGGLLYAAVRDHLA